ncbi:GNAT family N-acetyltransferase [Nocardia nova]|uniref:GNAT family N-acetyltransferase n=1 Tax=Nocardia nova TaxID=37330 RepID=UPI00341197C1
MRISQWLNRSGIRAVEAVLSVPPPIVDDAAALRIEQSHEPASGIAVLGRLFVGPEGRNQAVGEQLTRAAMDYGAEWKLRLVLDVMEKDEAAVVAVQSVGVARETHSERTMNVIVDVVRALEPWSHRPGVRQLRELLLP